MRAARLWFARIVVTYAVAIFAFLGWVYAFGPDGHYERYRIAADVIPEYRGFLRSVAGAFFLGTSIISAWGLARAANLVPALKILTLYSACIVALRLLGIAQDGATELQLIELRDEGVSFLLFGAALLAHPRD